MFLKVPLPVREKIALILYFLTFPLSIRAGISDDSGAVAGSVLDTVCGAGLLMVSLISLQRVLQHGGSMNISHLTQPRGILTFVIKMPLREKHR
jgi:hypothetical protein